MRLKSLIVAEGKGFEPSIQCYPYNGLANRLRFPPEAPKQPETPCCASTFESADKRNAREQRRFATAQKRAQQINGIGGTHP